MTSPRSEVLASLAGRLEVLAPDRRVHAGVDSVSGSGKTTFADELAASLRRPVPLVRMDGFHRPRWSATRADGSPAGCYADTYDTTQLHECVLDRTGRAVPRVFDHKADRPVTARERVVPPGAVVLVDGVFLLRPELAGCFRHLIVRLLVDPTSRSAGSSSGTPTCSVVQQRCGPSTTAGTDRRSPSTLPRRPSPTSC